VALIPCRISFIGTSHRTPVFRTAAHVVYFSGHHLEIPNTLSWACVLLVKSEETMVCIHEEKHTI
jgi:hypothetical protein